jgi:HAD superfamily hydrolase (TIGR01509 family)
MAGPTIQAVIFDMDGVLTDSEPLINAAAVAMFRERGLGVQPEDFLPFIGTGEDRYIGGVAQKYGFQLELSAAKKRTYEIYLDLVPTRLAAFPGAQALVHACRAAGLKIAVASSADRVKIEANLRWIGLPPELWDAVVTGEDVVNKKPAPDIFLAAARKLGLPAGACTVVEDAVNGIQAAKAAGTRCVAVAQSFKPELLHAADVVRSTIADVTLPDLTGSPANSDTELPPPLSIPPPGTPRPDAAQTPAPRPWGFWATVGFGLLIAMHALMNLIATVETVVSLRFFDGKL